MAYRLTFQGARLAWFHSWDFPILVCDLSTNAIIGTDTLGSILPHTLDIKNGLLFTVGHCSIPPHSEAVLHCTTHTYGGRPVIASQWPTGGPYCFFLQKTPAWWSFGRWWIHRDGRSLCWCQKLRTRSGHGGTIFRDWHDCPGVSDSANYGPTTSSVV